MSSTNDPTVVKINTFSAIAGDYGYPGNYLVEFLTWMKYVPPSLAKWKRVAEERHKEYLDMFVSMFREVEDQIVTWFLFASLYRLADFHPETRGRTPKFCRDFDSRTGSLSPE